MTMNKNYQLVCNTFLTQKSNINFTYCVLPLRKETVFLLQKPKLIYALNHISIQSGKRNSNTVELDTRNFYAQEKQIALTSLTNRFDKKNRSHVRTNEDSDIRKNRTKAKRKNKNQINLNNANILSPSDPEILSANELKSLKSSKSKKKTKQRKELDTKTSSNATYDFHSTDLDSNSEQKKVPQDSKEIILDGPLTIEDLAAKLCITEAAIITWLFLKGISVTINQIVDSAIAKEVAKHYNFRIVDDSFKSKNIDSLSRLEKQDFYHQGVKRAPIITILGHVDHGKTTLLDCIRNTNLAKTESGGITQSIAGYEVEWEYKSTIEKLVFLDTPGHAAFAGMRLRSAEVTDIVVLVIAADDELKQQAIEALNYILDNQIPYIIAITKIDKQNADVVKIKGQLKKYGICDQTHVERAKIIEISSLKGQNIDLLLSSLCELAISLNLRADENCLAEGTVLESNLDKRTGPVANIIVQQGILRLGDFIVSGNIYGRVKAIKDSFQNRVDHAIPSSVVEIWGFSSIPQVGFKFYVVTNEKNAKYLTQSQNRNSNGISKFLNTRVTLDSYKQDSNLKPVNIILKSDTQGSLEAILNAFRQIPQEKVQINIIVANVGSISNKDVDLAKSSQSLVLGFNVETSLNTRSLIENLNIVVRTFSVIYDLLDYVEKYMIDLVDPEYEKYVIGKATVKTVFSINKGLVAGCLVNSGKLKKNLRASIYDGNKMVHDGFITSLKRAKDDVNEVVASYECGVMCGDFYAWKASNTIEAYELIEKRKSL
uniref:translation initiation factor 2 n=1 Tax=Gloiopeltis furcata TaxID=42017 RepID=UPI0028D7614A|nr:translation initiation factor 2 [Gloiopeltis furcata]WMP13892.1 translation initiation factor 2 [Gloiopeltis furcata]